VARALDGADGVGTPLYSWLDLTLLTGHTHQLRIHCAAAMGCPIVGDERLFPAPVREERPELLSRTQMYLHARCMSFRHPCRGSRDSGGDSELITIVAPMPEHWHSAAQLCGWAHLMPRDHSIPAPDVDLLDAPFERGRRIIG
jgi:hypothetical protein